ncbi:MAG: succinate dehydrogenase, cytochrome b556 subunit [Rhizobiaceae bacterium]
MSEAKARTGSARPLSPHLQIYKPIPTMVMSILHRLTGVALYMGTLLLVWWLVAAASGPAYFGWVSGIFSSLLGRAILFGFTWALMHHMLGGIRHFIWDMGHWFDKHTSTRLAWATLGGSLSLTVLVWIIFYTVR